MYISPQDFLQVVNAIDAAETLEASFDALMNNLPVKLASYHHFPSVGAVDYQSLGSYVAYNVPKEILDFFDSTNPKKPDPGCLATFQKGEFNWLTDLMNDPELNKIGHYKLAKETQDITGGGLCIPLFGPNYRRGYMFIAFGGTKAEFDPIFGYQVQALAQKFHVRYCTIARAQLKETKLTAREMEVLELIRYGKTNQEIAKSLDISCNTVTGYVKNIFLKMEVRDRVSASMRSQTTQVIF